MLFYRKLEFVILYVSTIQFFSELKNSETWTVADYLMTEERRKHQRYPFNAIAVVQEKTGSAGKTIPTLTQNISLSGIEFHSYIDIEEGTHVRVELKFTDNKGFSVTDVIEGRIVWQSYRGNFSAMGLSFDEQLSPDHNPVLYEYFRNVSKPL